MKIIRRIVTLAILAVVWQACAGCAVAGALAAKTIGDIPDPAAYVPPQQPMLVLVENYHHAADLEGPGDQLAELLTEQIVENKVAPVIQQSSLIKLREDRPKEYDKMNIIEVGKELGAKQVVYVDLKKCDVYRTVGSDALQAKVEAYVKVVDVETGLTKFPLVGDGEPFKTESDFTPDNANDTPLAMRNQMVGDLAVAIAQLFYVAKPK
jgi:hypothetical protein